MNQKLITLVVAIFLVCTLAVTPTSAKVVFADVATTDATYDEIQYLISLGAIKGYQEKGKTYYKPNMSVTRAQAAKMAVIAAGKSPLKVSNSSYTDVKVGTEQSTYIERARQLGLFTKTSGKFSPNATLSREEMSHVLSIAFNLNVSDYKDLPVYFPDVSSSNTYAPYIKAIYYNGITKGSDGKYMPKGSVTRAQFASFIARAKSDEFRLALPEHLDSVDPTQVIGLVSVTTDGLNVRTKPTTSSAVIGRVNTGGKLSVYAVEGNWLKVSYQGYYGYISKSYAKFLEQDGSAIGPSIKAVKTNTIINLYYKPTSSSKKIKQISAGSTLSVYKEIDGYYLTTVGGIPGYIVKNSTTDVGGSSVNPPPSETDSDNNDPVVTSGTTGKVTVASLNMRKSASGSSATIKKLSKGSVIAVHSIDGYWAKVTAGKDTGYVHKSYIKLVNEKGSPIKDRIIILDPGHGGKDPGAVNSGSTEKAIVLKVGNLVKQKLEANGAKVFTTRSGDTYPSLQERVKFTKDKFGEVYVSIHVNSATSTSAKGTETYYSITTGDQYEEDKKLATYINNEIVKNADMKNRGVKEAQYYVTRNMIIPSVLVELGFISNAEDRKKLINDKYVEIYAQSIYNGIVDYYRK
ncbi:N-acetylmuramoyl-L-alanine amidase [Solibacillus sp. FSL K6-1781]|uniref:N-acetylmuramoyl-L-alanine amidase n=1 Tax=unclassified Solibacillus TaxID=2637870 RepID=UPI0007FB4E68|nr:N-acetylmuramoyl-L-alanine amidase [Solibacillus silvestris]OBW60314.1 N-acetylmuramoyl-L-alanine amidase [Solibacillus silvestris]